MTIPMYMANGSASWVSLEFGAAAELHAPASACASGAEALALGLEMVRSGRAEVVVAGGAEAMIHPIVLAGFAAMRALSRRNDDPAGASRPFDADRDGFVLGEGAAVMVLESAAHAAGRGARVYAELAGAGRSADMYHIANPEPSGAGAARAMRRALADAELTADQIGHVNAHATGTPMGDTAELAAVRSALAPAVDGLLVTAVKSMTGHLLGAGGALEALVTTLSLYHGTVPPTRNVDKPDEVGGIEVVRDGCRPLTGRAAGAISNSFAFGGTTCLLSFAAETTHLL
ncbi:hypothetical protein Psuf_005210 [Phytohabitans suffuscus]|uniref:Ketosynthase family 3 (KS3) domain-containing protein n=1 Tax=Phytohabitans suffuscus TaxID=624315 RepID=A0A6F8YB47_9ACTN|nr:hypothetical protein Psuf_005210 [Phytohabitans suffuscus]